nr:MAG TPA: hypothetical protein [Caudoviricetes sp.]
MVNEHHNNYDWELFLKTQSLEAIDNFINYMSQTNRKANNFKSWLESACAVRFQRAELKIPPIKGTVI